MKRKFELRAIILGAAAGAMALLAGLTAYSAFEARRHFNDLVWVEHTHAVLDELQEERVQLKNAELGRRSYLARPSRRAREDVERATDEMIKSSDSLQVLTRDNPPQAGRASAIAGGARDIRESLEAPARGGPDAALPRIETATALLRAMEGEERRLLADREARARRTARAVAVALSAEFLLAAGLGAAALWLVMRGLGERERLLAELTSANEELDAFAHTAAHDLRAPLRAIDGYASILESERALPDEARRLLGKVRAKSEGMSRLIEDLLAFSRVKRQTRASEDVDMAALARRAAADASDAEPGRQVKLSIAPLPRVRGDAAMLALVWNNLLSNAYKYTRGRAPARIEIGGAVLPGTSVVYWIKDNGVGFDPRHASKLFKVFSRLHGAEIEGTGVGLALVRRVVERHGGTISAEGSVDGGARFRFVLPSP
ncbi:MAG TPA: ATP-binding protein [Elusimicrobiota bacterium]|nr:ATP-binding protein [Elusimicrobiota bacterium]